MDSVHPVWAGPPRRAAPDLEPAEPDERTPLIAPRTARAMVRFTDKTLHLCWVRARRNRSRAWLIHLAWGDSGQIRDAWFRHDPQKVQDPPKTCLTALMLGPVVAVRYSFFVHRTVPRWRLVIPEAGPFPERTTAGQWQHSRDRSAADTNPDVRAEVQRQGYCLFTISASFDELDRDLRSTNHS